MGTIVVSENVTLDGVVQDPTGEEGSRHGGWFLRVGTNDREAFSKAALDEVLAAEAFLLGRRTYEFLASRWPSREGELADRLNSIPKYVVSSTLEDPDWNNSTVIKGDAVPSWQACASAASISENPYGMGMTPPDSSRTSSET